MIYRPEEMTHPRKTNRYIQGIDSAIRQLDLLTEYLASEKCGSSGAYIVLAFSIKHHLRMLKNLNESIKSPGDIVKGGINHCKEIEQQSSATILFENLPENGAEVPFISPYELAIR